MLRWSEEEIDILKNNYYLSNKNNIIKLLPNRKWSNIKQKARKLNLSMEYKQRVNIPDESIFSKPNEINSYWAGFLAADGCIIDRELNTALEVTLSSLDYKHLLKLVNFLNLNKSIIKNKIQKNKNYSRFKVISNQICKDLYTHFSITPRKTFTLKPPNLTKENYIISYILGYLDGDGCIYHKKEKNKKTKLSVQICGNKNVLEWMSYNIQNILKIDIFKKLTKRKKIFTINASCSKAQKFLSLLYSINKLKNIYLKRKYKKYVSFKFKYSN